MKIKVTLFNVFWIFFEINESHVFVHKIKRRASGIAGITADSIKPFLKTRQHQLERFDIFLSFETWLYMTFATWPFQLGQYLCITKLSCSSADMLSYRTHNLAQGVENKRNLKIAIINWLFWILTGEQFGSMKKTWEWSLVYFVINGFNNLNVYCILVDDLLLINEMGERAILKQRHFGFACFWFISDLACRMNRAKGSVDKKRCRLAIFDGIYN